jgi:hypothetical protein
MNDHSTDDSTAPAPPSRGNRWANAFYVLISPFALAFTGYNFWRLAVDGELYIRYQGRFVAPDYSLYFWVTLLFYAVIFVLSAIVLALFFAWAVGRIKRFGESDGYPRESE